jgi:hypothetical protein
LTIVNRSDCRISVPEMMQPPETSELTAVPRRFSSSWTNLAGGTLSEYVQIGQSLSQRSSSGVKSVRSTLAFQKASTVPTSRQ